MSNTIPPPPLAERSLGEIVKHDARAAGVLERFGLDYCCGGRRTLEAAAAARQIPIAPVTAALEALGPPVPGQASDTEWAELDMLTQHIVGRHHRYVRELAPTIQAWLAKLEARHGDRQPELKDVRRSFDDLVTELTTHMAKEENLLFPFIDELAAARRAGSRLAGSPFGTVLNPIRVMEADHRSAADLLARLRMLTRDFTLPEDACTTYRLCYAELARFESDLHWHVHLENNVLFPRALELEQQLA